MSMFRRLSESYNVTITMDAENIAGNGLESNYSGEFTTGLT